MPVISFQFSHTTDRSTQERLLGRLKQAPGVRAVGRVDPDSSDADIARMCFAETSDPNSTTSLAEELRKAPGVESTTVSVEPRRGLA